MTIGDPSRKRGRRRHAFDRLMSGLIYGAVVAAIVPLVAIVGEVVIQGLPQINWEFLTGLPRPPTIPGGGIFNAIEGSTIMVGLAALIAVPLGVGAGIYFSEWPESRLSFISSFTNDVLAEFPTITLGIFVYLVVVLTTHTFSAIAGAIALSIVMIPIVARTTEESLKLVPHTLREASMALGIPRWKTVISIVISTGKTGLATGILLSVARAAGETAPLVVTALWSVYPVSNLWGPTGSLPYLIFYYGLSPYQIWHGYAWGGAFLLVVFMLGLNLSVKLLIGRKFAGIRAEI
ncbi:MAG TPA: phosphate ABC transporter permease PstA [Nitrososphaerales archaeon]|nr:phosphate ABC transporter permease PstA [Nitrososphaerales archaeon]